MIKIKIADKEQHCDIDSITLTITSPFFDEDLINGSYSYPVELPAHADNNKIFNHAGDIHGSIGNQIRSYEGDLYWRGDVLKTGVKINILKYTGNVAQSGGKYHINITGSESIYGNAIKGKKLKDLLLEENIYYATTAAVFATDVMKGNIIQYPYLGFAEIYNPGYIDTTRADYDPSKDAVHADILNHITLAGGTWSFTTPNQNHRHTIPFIRMVHILKACFASYGYTVDCELFNDPDFNDIYLYNNRSLEIKNATGVDINRTLSLKNHVPDMYIVDFLLAVCQVFGIVPITQQGSKHFSLVLYKSILESAQIIDITPYITEYYEKEKLMPEESGLHMSWMWDGADSYPGDKVLEIDNGRVRASVKSQTELASLSFSPALTQGDLAYVANENYYFSWDTEWNKWIYYSEGQQAYVRNSEHNSKQLTLSPLLTHAYSDSVGNYNLQRCAATQRGSYYTNTKIYTGAECGLRMFYIKMISNGSINIPRSFVHNYNSAGQKIAQYSLSLNAEYGIYNNFHQRWQVMKEEADQIKISIKHYPFDIDILKSMKIKLLSGTYLLKEAREHLGVDKEAELFLIKI